MRTNELKTVPLERQRRFRAVDVRHGQQSLPFSFRAVRDLSPRRAERRGGRDFSGRQLGMIDCRSGDAQVGLDPVVPGREIVVVDGPRVLVAGAPRIVEIVAREARDSAAPMVRQSAGRDVFVEDRCRITGDSDVARSCAEWPMDARDGQPADADRQASSALWQSGVEQRHVDAGLGQQHSGGSRGRTAPHDYDRVVPRSNSLCASD